MNLSDPQNLPCRCDDCGEVTPAGQLDIIKDIEERLSPGSIVPAGQCPHCAALAYYADGYAPSGTAQAQTERIGATTSALKRAEDFIAGFEGDPTQEGLSDLLAAIRAAIAGAPRDELQIIRDAARAHDDKMCDRANDGKDAWPPDGDDYNELFGIVMHGAPADPVRDAARDMLAALRTEQQELAQLCDMVNHLAARLDLGRKVNPVDWGEKGRTAIAKAEGQGNG